MHIFNGFNLCLQRKLIGRRRNIGEKRTEKRGERVRRKARRKMKGTETEGGGDRKMKTNMERRKVFAAAVDEGKAEANRGSD